MQKKIGIALMVLLGNVFFYTCSCMIACGGSRMCSHPNWYGVGFCAFLDLYVLAAVLIINGMKDKQ